MAIASDIITRSDQLISDRQQWETVWADCAKFGLPLGDRFFPFTMNARRASITSSGGGLLEAPKANEHGREIYDSTAVTAIDRLTAGLESLVTPAAYKWHELKPKMLGADAEVPHDQQLWLEMVNDYMRLTREDPACGWGLANQSAIRAMCAFGTGVYYTWEGNGTAWKTATEVPVNYQYMPLSECYLGVNSKGEHDQLCRRFFMTARQCMQEWGNKNHAKVKELASKPSTQDRPVEIIHAVWPRNEGYWKGVGNRAFPMGSWFVDVDNKHLIDEGGYKSFPFIVYCWNREALQPYGESPIMLALAEIKSMQVMQKSALMGVQQLSRPPLLMSSDGLMNRPNLNPGSINYGGLDSAGRPRLTPLITTQFSTAVVQVMEQQKNSLKDLLYVNLWQILISNPQMTATEALLRAQEKGDLLSPIGLKVQRALSKLIDREWDIYEGKGAFREGSPLQPPPSLEGTPLNVEYSAPINRLRRQSEVVGIQRTIEIAGFAVKATGDPSHFDAIDFDKAIKITQEVTGAPVAILRDPEALAALREAKAQQQQASQMMANAQAGGDAMKAMGEGAMAAKAGADATGLTDMLQGGGQ